MSRIVRFGLITAAITGTLLFVGCAQSPIVEVKPSPAAEEDVTQEPEIMVEAFVLPECDQLVPADSVEEVFWERFEPWQSEKVATFTASAMGPSANTAFAEAKQVRTCGWAIPKSSAIATGFVAELNDSTSQELLAELRSSEYVEGSYGEATTFSYTAENQAFTLKNWYAFQGSAWVAVMSTGAKDPQIAGQLFVDAVSDNQ